MTENTVETPSLEELQAELAELREKQKPVNDAETLSTRDRSPVTPQDRKSKAGLTDSKVTVVYKDVPFEVDFVGLDDADLFGQDQNNPFVQAQAIKNVVGEDGYLSLCDLVRGTDGRAKASDVQVAFGEIMQDAAVKNS